MTGTFSTAFHLLELIGLSLPAIAVYGWIIASFGRDRKSPPLEDRLDYQLHVSSLLLAAVAAIPLVLVVACRGAIPRNDSAISTVIVEVLVTLSAILCVMYITVFCLSLFVEAKRTYGRTIGVIDAIVSGYAALQERVDRTLGTLRTIASERGLDHLFGYVLFFSLVSIASAHGFDWLVSLDDTLSNTLGSVAPNTQVQVGLTVLFSLIISYTTRISHTLYISREGFADADGGEIVSFLILNVVIVILVLRGVGTLIETPETYSAVSRIYGGATSERLVANTETSIGIVIAVFTAGVTLLIDVLQSIWTAIDE